MVLLEGVASFHYIAIVHTNWAIGAPKLPLSCTFNSSVPQIKDSPLVVMTEKFRPLSPHLQIYKPQLTSVLSITHRLTGVVLSFGILLFTCWIVSLGYNMAFYDQLMTFFGSWLGQFMLLGFLFSYSYHLLNGIRHLFWDIGLGYALSTAYRTGWTVVVGSILLTGLIWVCALKCMKLGD